MWVQSLPRVHLQIKIKRGIVNVTRPGLSGMMRFSRLENLACRMEFICPTNSQTHCVAELTDQPILRGKLNTGSGNVAMSSLRMLYALLLSHQKRIPETYTENTNKQRGRTRERRATQRKRERTRVIEGEVLGSKPEASLCIAGALNHFKGKQQYGSHVFSFHNWLLGLVV